MQLFEKRLLYRPKVPSIFRDLTKIVLIEEPTLPLKQEIQPFFAKTGAQKQLLFSTAASKKLPASKVGVVFSGGQAPGGHNVITGLFDALEQCSKKSRLVGFLGGPRGILQEKFSILERKKLANYRNQGGFELLGSGRDKIETQEQLQQARHTVTKLCLDGLVIIGGDDSNTNAALLAEYFQQQSCKTAVIGVPKTIDGDLKTAAIATSFGFDTAAKTYSEMVGNIAKDALSAKKYYHFIRVMGRAASHLALECALQTRANLTLISEEVAQRGESLKELCDQIAELIIRRAKLNKHYGLILIPEGIVEHISDLQLLIEELNGLLSCKKEFQLASALSQPAFDCYRALPAAIQQQLLLERDPHGNVQISKIESEKLFIEMVTQALIKRGDQSVRFAAQSHFFGYEGRAALPTNFDCDLCYSLGRMAALLLAQRKTGYLCALSHLTAGLGQAKARAIPIASLMQLEKRKGVFKPVIAKSLVNLKGKPFQAFQQRRAQWELNDEYRCPGPIQFFGELKDLTTKTLQLESMQ